MSPQQQQPAWKQEARHDQPPAPEGTPEKPAGPEGTEGEKQ
jgi:hypothetical protein